MSSVYAEAMNSAEIQSIEHHLTKWLQFSKRSMEDDYTEYSFIDTNLSILVGFSFMMGIASLTTIASAYESDSYLFIFGNAIRIVPLLLTCAYVYYNYHGVVPPKGNTLGTIIILSHTIFGGIFIAFSHRYQNSCEAYSCIDMPPEDYLHFGFLASYLLFNTTHPFVVKCHAGYCPILSIILQSVFLFFTGFIAHISASEYFFLGLITLSQAIVFYSNETGSRDKYLRFVELESTMRERVLADNRAELAREREEELRYTIGNVAHDLKSPLQAFAFELNTLKARLSAIQTTDAVADALESLSLLKSIEVFMLMNINRSMDYTKVTSGIALMSRLETINIQSCISWMVQCLGHTSSNEAVAVVTEPLPPDVNSFLVTDKQWLIENLLCLTSNAQKFTSHGNIVIRTSLAHDCAPLPGESTVFVSDRSSQKRSLSTVFVLIEVEDSGIGISLDQRADLFQPFNQAQKRAGGTGLGLYSLSRRVESLGGSCGVSDRKNGQRGSRFWFTFPYVPDFTASNATNEDDPLLPGRRPSGYDNSSLSALSPTSDSDSVGWASMKVLVVDDSLLIQKTTKRALHVAGYEVDIASNGEEGLDKVMASCQGLNDQYAIVLMDIQMPIMDGLEAVKRIRSWEATQHPPLHQFIIGTSANSDAETRREALEVGMDQFLSKPLSVKNMRELYIASLTV